MRSRRGDPRRPVALHHHRPTNPCPIPARRFARAPGRGTTQPPRRAHTQPTGVQGTGVQPTRIRFTIRRSIDGRRSTPLEARSRRPHGRSDGPTLPIQRGRDESQHAQTRRQPCPRRAAECVPFRRSARVGRPTPNTHQPASPNRRRGERRLERSTRAEPHQSVGRVHWLRHCRAPAIRATARVLLSSPPVLRPRHPSRSRRLVIVLDTNRSGTESNPHHHDRPARRYPIIFLHNRLVCDSLPQT